MIELPLFDSFCRPSHVSVMMDIGNAAVNRIFEARINGTKPTAGSSREEKEKWIRAKYEQKEFLCAISGAMRVEQLLIEAVSNGDVIGVATYLAHQGATTSPYTQDLKTPLHVAAASGKLSIVQLLLWVCIYCTRSVSAENNISIYVF